MHGTIRDDLSAKETTGSESNILSFDCREFILVGCRWNIETLCVGTQETNDTVRST
jgi:hypothetical protein